MSAIPLRQPSGDPACAAVLIRCRDANEEHIDRVLEAIFRLPPGHPQRVELEAQHNTLQALAAALWALVPPPRKMEAQS